MKAEFHLFNRQKLYASLPDQTLVMVFSGLPIRKTADENYPFYTDRNFLYLTGIDREDFILLAEKENDNSTRLYTLEKFKIRYDKVINKDYLAGRYGAVPVFKDFDYLWGEGENNWRDCI